MSEERDIWRERYEDMEADRNRLRRENRALLSDNQAKCLELAEKAETIRELQAQAESLREGLREFLANRACSCGGWTCPRCAITLGDAEALLSEEHKAAALMAGGRELPNLSDLWDAYVAGALDIQHHPGATVETLNRAADGWVKLWQERRKEAAALSDPRSTAEALRERWRPASPTIAAGLRSACEAFAEEEPAEPLPTADEVYGILHPSHPINGGPGFDADGKPLLDEPAAETNEATE